MSYQTMFFLKKICINHIYEIFFKVVNLMIICFNINNIQRSNKRYFCFSSFTITIILESVENNVYTKLFVFSANFFLLKQINHVKKHKL